MASVDENVAQHFAGLFYQLMDTNRPETVKLYHPQAQVERDGQLTIGQQDIANLLANLPPTQHTILSIQGVPGDDKSAPSTFVHVHGMCTINGIQYSFEQLFLLVQSASSAYGIQKDRFVSRPVQPGDMPAPYPFQMNYQQQQQHQPHLQDQQQQQQLPNGAPPVAATTDTDRRSIFVGHVEYRATDDDLRQFFQNLGTVNRVTIKRDFQTKESKGYAYIEFVDEASATNALNLNGAEFMGLQLKITPKRTNLPGYSKQYGNQIGGAGRGRGGYSGGGRGGRGNYMGAQGSMNM